MLDLSSTYITWAKRNLPKVANIGPWKARSNYFSDFIFAKYGRFDQSLELVKRPHWEMDNEHICRLLKVINIYLRSVELGIYG